MAAGQESDTWKALEREAEVEVEEEAAPQVPEEDVPTASGVEPTPEADETVDMSALRRPVRRTSPANNGYAFHPDFRNEHISPAVKPHRGEDACLTGKGKGSA